MTFEILSVCDTVSHSDVIPFKDCWKVSNVFDGTCFFLDKNRKSNYCSVLFCIERFFAVLQNVFQQNANPATEELQSFDIPSPGS